jgi:hypothetical protein
VNALPGLLAVGLAIVLAGCTSGGGEPNSMPTPSGSTAVVEATTEPCPTPPGTAIDVFSVPGDFAALEPTTYWVDPDHDPCTQLRVLYTIPAPGWQAWTGALKEFDDRRVGVSIVTVTNLVVDGCTDHGLADPPVGAGTGDLATALAELEPFVVTKAPADVTAYGYDGTYLELQLPETIDAGACFNNEVVSWDAPVLSYAFHGYYPGMIEEFWILDVDGTRLAIITNRSPDSTEAETAELRALLDSIEIEP